MGTWSPGPGATAGNDIYTGDGTDETVDGLAGDDTLNGFGGNDTLNGNAGNDTIEGGDGNDNMDGGADTDTLSYANASAGITISFALFGSAQNTSGAGIDTITNFENLIGSSFNDTLYGNGNDNIIDGGGGVDTMSYAGVGNYVTVSLALQGSAQATFAGGNDTLLNFENLIGTSNNDTLEGDAANNVIDGGSGTDILSYANAGSAVTVSLALQGAAQNTIGAGTDTLSNFENLTGSAYGDMLTGNSGNNVIVGGNGDDTLDGGAGNDTLTGGGGTDTVSFASGNATVVDLSVLIAQNTGNGSDTLSGIENIIGSALNDTLTGDGNANAMSGGAGADTISGGAGADSLTGGAGIDTMTGGIGDDHFYVNVAGESGAGETYDGGADTDVLWVLGAGSNDFQGASFNSIEWLSLLSNVQTTFDAEDVGAGLSSTLSISASDSAFGAGITLVRSTTGTTDVSGWVFYKSIAVTLNGTSGDDTLIGANTFGGNALNGGNGNDTLTGGYSSDILTGGAGADTLNGAGGNDTMVGGDGNDSYVVDSASDTVTEQANEGVDTVTSSTSLTLSANVENLTLTGSAFSGTGNAENNIILGTASGNTLGGGAGADTLDGGAGADSLTGGTGIDTMTGGIGDDHFYVNVAGESGAGETYDGGADVDVLWVLGAGENDFQGATFGSMEWLSVLSNVHTTFDAEDVGAGLSSTLSISASDSASGAAITLVRSTAGTTDVSGWVFYKSIAVTLNGTSGDDTLIGANNFAGNTLNGGAGADTLTGNFGNDTLNGGIGADVLNGGGGNDTMVGGDGADNYVVDSASDIITEQVNEGIDTVTASANFTLSVNVENLTLTAGALTGTGNAENNIILGNANNNTLNGGAGADTMVGGTGNDIYYVDNLGDVVTENGGEGASDEVRVSVNAYTLAAEVEIGRVDTTSGLSLIGNVLNNTLYGNSGDDTLNGGAGADAMTGGAGNDTYVVDNGGDVVTENASEGTDTVQSSITYTLGANVENLTLTGGSAIDGSGNALANLITGNSAANFLSGGDGDDTLDGGAGTDTMAGGAGDDTYYVDSLSDVVTENSGEGAADTVHVTVTNYTLASEVEIGRVDTTSGLSLIGNALNNTLYGNSGGDTLNGGAGADAMTGGAGNDAYVVDDLGDVITEGAGEGVADAVLVGVSGYTVAANVEVAAITLGTGVTLDGNALSNVLYGAAGADIINGGDGDDTIRAGAGLDTMSGGLGNDTFFVAQAGDIVIENLNEGGSDAVIVQIASAYTLTANVEIGATFLGTGANITGNELDNQLYGNAGADTLNGAGGNDTMQGAGGSDTMIGGDGNDTYFFEDAGDTITENANEGIDAVIVFTSSYTLAANVEVGARFLTTAFTLTGNELDNQLYGNAGADTLNGGLGNDTLSGGAGADTMVGGVGNDTYFIEDAGDVVTENANEGSDAAIVLIGSYTLAANVEVGATFLTSGVSITGNGLNNRIYGNAGADTLNGGAGADVLEGSGGADTLTGGSENDVFFFVAGQSNGDAITDFAGNGAAAGDVMRFAGYGTTAGGATFVQLDATHWQINSADGTIHDTITLANSASVDVSDWLFV